MEWTLLFLVGDEMQANYVEGDPQQQAMKVRARYQQAVFLGAIPGHQPIRFADMSKSAECALQ